MSQSNEPVSVRILDREYTVGVSGEERDSLAARLGHASLVMRLHAERQDHKGAHHPEQQVDGECRCPFHIVTPSR